VIDCFNE
jgi:hypothetical protein